MADTKACTAEGAPTSSSWLLTLMRPLFSLGKVADLKQGIAKLYDESCGLWEHMWGDHMHHGYYPKDGPAKGNREAQVEMIDQVLSWAGVTSVTSMVDVGCGIGGSSMHIVRKFAGACAKGITLSPRQAARANERAAEAGMAERLDFCVGDAHSQPYPSDAFDLVWSLESGEHMDDKRKFVGEMARVCAPGGRVVVVTWCHRRLAPGEAALRPDEATLLSRLSEVYYLPPWCSVDDYQRWFEEAGLSDIRTADWTEEVTPFWGAVIDTALTWQGVRHLLTAGWSTIKGALVMPLMHKGLTSGLIKFQLITALKPQQQQPEAATAAEPAAPAQPAAPAEPASDELAEPTAPVASASGSAADSATAASRA